MLSRVLLMTCLALVIASPALARSSLSIADQARSFPVPPVRAKAAVVMDASNGQVLASLNPHLRLPIASTTKIMTALVALQLGHLTDQITVPKTAFDFEADATVMGLHPGQKVTLQDLLYGLLLPSGADAANTIAIHYAGSEARFVDQMNREASALGMRDTHYVNTHGLTAPHAYSTAYDLAVLGQYVSYIPELVKITSTRSYSWDGHVLTNLNHVLFWYPGIDGLKPGYTDDAGICQVLDVRRDRRHVVVVLLHTPDLDLDARNLLNYGLGDFSWVRSWLPGDSPSYQQLGEDRGGAYVYFPASGHYVHGALAATFRADGGLTTFGLPRTEALTVGRVQVQYFQNGALSYDPLTKRIMRLPLGLTPLPTPSSTPKPTRTPGVTVTPTLTPTPSELTVTLDTHASSTPGSAPTPTPKPKPTRTPKPPTIRPAPTSVPTPTHTPGHISVALVFAAFQRSHGGLLGNPTANARWVHGYLVQPFSYSAVVFEPRSHSVYVLPIGDRLLAAQGYLPDRPGNVYPDGFAPGSILRAIGWLLFRR
jgi:D-alanyl-D-alanine carboxypeptidase